MEEYRKSMFQVAEEFQFTTEELIDLYSTYLLDIQEYIINIEIVHTQKFWSELQLMIHTIKGMSANLRLNDVFTESSKLNSYLKEEKIPSLEWVKAYLELLDKSQEKVKCLLSSEFHM